MMPTHKYAKTFTKIEPGAPVMTPGKHLGVVQWHNNDLLRDALTPVLTTEGPRSFLEGDLTLLQPDLNLTVGREGVSGTPISTPRGYGVIRGFSISWGGFYRWGVDLIGADGDVFYADREDITVLVPHYEVPKPKEDPPAEAAKLAEAQVLRAVRYAHQQGVAAFCAGCRRPLAGPKDIQLRMKGHIDEDKEKAAAESARASPGSKGPTPCRRAAKPCSA